MIYETVVGSKGAASITAGTSTTFDFSSLGKKGNAIRFGAQSGGPARFTIDNSTPNSTFTSLTASNGFINLDGSQGLIVFNAYFDVFKIRPVVDCVNVYIELVDARKVGPDGPVTVVNS